MKASFSRCAIVFPLWLALTLAAAAQTTAPEFFQSARQKQEKDVNGAIDDYTRSILLDPAHASSYNNRGLLKKRKGELEEAMADYNRAIELDAKYAAPCYNRGNLRKLQGDLKGAMADFEKGIAADPNYALSYEGRGQLREDDGDTDGALADFSKAIALNPGYAPPYRLRANVRKRKGDYDGALVDCNEAIKIDPKYVTGYENRAAVYFIKGDWKKALEDHRQSGKLSKTVSDYREMWIWLTRVRLGEKDAADKDLAAFAEKKSKNATVQTWRMKALDFLLDKITEDDLIAAITADNEELAIDQSCDTLYFAGMKRLFAGDKAGAVERFKKCLTADHKQKRYTFQYARAELERLEK